MAEPASAVGDGAASRTRQLARVQLPLVIVPDLPLAEDRFEPPVRHGRAQNPIHLIAQRDVARRGDDDVVPSATLWRLRVEPVVAAHRAIGQHVVEQHRVDATVQRIGVGMDIVVVGHGDDPVLALGGEQDVVGDGAGERRDTPSAQSRRACESGRDRRLALSALL